MITIPTVLILGAGASKDFGIPCGKGLKIEVCELLRTCPDLFADLNFHPDLIKEFRRKLGDSAFFSVDAFLEHNTKFIDLGKAAIASALLPYEESSNLHMPKNNWYQHLFWLLTKDATFNDLVRNRLSIITFNYDRSFEQYFYNSLESSFGDKTYNEYLKVLNEMQITHVYGSLGRLEWQDQDEGVLPLVRYGARTNDKNTIISASLGIKIVPETITKIPDSLTVRVLLNSAHRIYFLGFAYHRANIERLAITQLPEGHLKDIKGTSYELPITTVNWVESLKFNNPHHRIILIKSTIYDFIYKSVDLALQ